MRGHDKMVGVIAYWLHTFTCTAQETNVRTMGNFAGFISDRKTLIEVLLARTATGARHTHTRCVDGSEELGPIRMGSGMDWVRVCVCVCGNMQFKLKNRQSFPYFSPFAGFCICCLLFCRSTLQLLSNCEMLCNRTLTAAKVDFTIGNAVAVALGAPSPLAIADSIRIPLLFSIR